jgi:hypothetical protein
MSPTYAIAKLWSTGKKVEPKTETKVAENTRPFEFGDNPLCQVCGFETVRVGRCFICPNCCNSTGCD